MELKRKYFAGAVVKDGTLNDRQIRVSSSRRQRPTASTT